MFQRPFGRFAAFLIATVLCPICLPLVVFVGYPALLMIGVASLLRWLNGEIKSPRQTAAVWVIYLGFVLILHGVTICFDTPLADGEPPAEQKRFGNGLAYLGAAMAGVSAIVAYSLDPAHLLARTSGARSDIDDHSTA